MSLKEKQEVWGGAVIGALVGGQAVHWLLTPIDHPNASGLRTVLVVLQAAIGFGLWIWAMVKFRKMKQA